MCVGWDKCATDHPSLFMYQPNTALTSVSVFGHGVVVSTWSLLKLEQATNLKIIMCMHARLLAIGG